jgi:anti-sigma factor RsiW
VICIELVEVITAYVEGALPEPDRAAFEAHLSECGKCGDYVEQFRQVIEATGRIDADVLAPEVRDGLVAAFRGWAGPG